MSIGIKIRYNRLLVPSLHPPDQLLRILLCGLQVHLVDLACPLLASVCLHSIITAPLLFRLSDPRTSIRYLDPAHLGHHRRSVNDFDRGTLCYAQIIWRNRMLTTSFAAPLSTIHDDLLNMRVRSLRPTALRLQHLSIYPSIAVVIVKSAESGLLLILAAQLLRHLKDS